MKFQHLAALLFGLMGLALSQGLGSKNSFVESRFCGTYGCVFEAKSDYMNSPPPGGSVIHAYRYLLKRADAYALVERDASMRIFGVHIFTGNQNGAYGNAFADYVTMYSGIEYKLMDVLACEEAARRKQSGAYEVKIGKYFIGCQLRGQADKLTHYITTRSPMGAS